MLFLGKRMQMSDTLFFAKLGHNRELSKLELSILMEILEIQRKSTFFEFKNFLFFTLPKELEKEFFSLINKTGSIVKVGKAVLIGKKKDSLFKIKKNFEAKLEQIIEQRYKEIKPPMKIALNVHCNLNELEDYSSFTKTIIRKIANEHRLSINLRRAKKISFELAPAQYYREKFSKKGVEISVFKIKSKIYIGKTIWVTNPNKDILLDESRPVRFFTHGTSIKVARSMVFLSKVKERDLLIDPFCGTGTILIIGLLRNCQVIGIDIDRNCINAAKENIEVLRKKGHVNTDSHWELYNADVKELSKLLKKKADAIVTEPYLGPFLKRLPTYEKGKDIMKELERLYKQAFEEFEKAIKKGGRVVFVIPEYNYRKKGIIAPDINKIIGDTSFKLQTRSSYFNVSLPIKIGRKHNVISRRLLITEKL